MAQIIRNREQLIAVLHERREELNISFEVLDELAGLPARYSSKLLAPRPLKNVGPMALGALLGALALGIAEVVIVEDPAQAARIRHRWTKRTRHGPRRKPTQCVVRPGLASQSTFTFENDAGKTHVEHEDDRGEDRPRTGAPDQGSSR